MKTNRYTSVSLNAVVRSNLPSAVTDTPSSRLCAQFAVGEIVFAEFERRAFAVFPVRGLRAPQLDATNFAGDRLGQIGEFKPSHALERSERRPAMPEDRQRRRAVRRMAGGEHQKRLGHGEPDRVG